MPTVLEIEGPDKQIAEIEVADDFDMSKVNQIDFSQVFSEPVKDEVNFSPNAVDFIKTAEAFTPNAYMDGQTLSIGYGTKFKDLEEADSVTEGQADGLLRDHLEEEVIPWMRENITVKLNQDQADAVSSLIYNVGSGNFGESRAFKALNKGDFDTFKREAFSKDRGFTKITTEAGVKRTSPGLVGRRKKERMLFDGERNV